MVHFTFDLWTSPNHRAFLGIVGHWVGEDGKLHGTLIGLRRFHGAHTGINQAEHFWEVIKFYELETKIGYFTLHNASNNDTALVQIAAYLAQRNIKFNPRERRLRCFGHVINLVVKAFLWGVNTEVLEGLGNFDAPEDEEQEIQELLEWRKQGSMGKLRNICVWICRTPQRRDSFKSKVQSHGGVSGESNLPIVGSITRWGGDYDSLKRAFLLKEPLQEFVAAAIRNERGIRSEYNLESARLDELTLDDWDELQAIMEILEPFKAWSLRLQGKCSNGSLYDIFLAMDDLLSSLENARIQYSLDTHSPHLRTSIDTAWVLLNKYRQSLKSLR